VKNFGGWAKRRNAAQPSVFECCKMPLILSPADKRGACHHIFSDGTFNFKLEILISLL
jgi:hypothetical protein